MNAGLKASIQIGSAWGGISAYISFFGAIARQGVPFPIGAKLLLLPSEMWWWLFSLSGKTLMSMFANGEGLLLGLMLWLPYLSAIAITLLIYFGIKQYT